MAEQFRAGRIDAQWLAEFDEGENPWQCVSTKIDDPDYRDAFLGNGYIGQRIGPDGQGASPPRGGRFVAGLWGDVALIAPPAWASLRYHDGQAAYGRDVGRHERYSQTLQLDRAVLATNDLWSTAGPQGQQTTEMESLTFISRTRRNVAVMVVRVRPRFAGEVSFEDELDGSDISDAADWQAKAGQTMTLSVSLGPRRRGVGLASRLIAHGADAAEADFDRAERRIARRLRLRVRPGQECVVTKIVALATDADADDPQAAAQAMVEQAAAVAERLLDEHVAAWADLWRGRIEVENPRLQRLLNAALYQLYSNLRPDVHWSIGPCGLTGGSYGGRVFWDADLWIFPAVLPLAPQLARSIVEYRVRTLPAARANARAENCAGASYAWESAETGAEVVSQEYDDMRHQRHIVSDVALAQWKYCLVTGDETYLRERGADVILGCAEYWASRARYDAVRDRYELPGICCADEAAGVRDNNAFTNWSAVRTLQIATTVSRKLGQPTPDAWDTIIRKMYCPFDEDRQLYLEYDGYDGALIKQADTALLVYPYEMPMNDDLRANIVDFYSTKYPPPPRGTIMMSSSIDGIVHCRLGRREKAWQALASLLAHFRAPFFLVSERSWNEHISFQTGLGGFIQLVLNGFAGVRFDDDGLVVAPCLPPGWQRMALRGLHYRGVRLDVVIEDGGQRVRVENLSARPGFPIRDGAGRPIE